MNPQDAWLATRGQLELQLPQHTYDTWVRDCKFIAYDAGVFTISVQNAYAKDWLETRLYRAIQYTLSDIFREQIEICFVVSNPVQSQQGWADTKTDGLPFGTTPHPYKQPSVPPRATTPPPPPHNPWQASPFAAQESANDDWDPQLRTTNTFDNFVVGPNNQMAQAAAFAVSQNPGAVYNPLFIYGDTGLGKTHLLYAIGNLCHQRGLRVLYTSSEEFTNALVESIRAKTTADFRDHFREVDVLLIDDIQFIAGKESTQEEFFHTFNTLHNHGKQVVMAADRSPGKIRGLEKRLVSRLEWGLQVDIQAPSFETRLAIVQDKSALRGHRLPPPVAELVAKQKGNIRMLEGLVTTLIAHSTLMQVPLTFDLARMLLSRSETAADGSTQLRPRDIADTKRRLSLEQVLRGTANALQLELKDIVSKSRTQEISQARHWAIYIAREETQASWLEIGNALGGRNHSTVLHSYNKIADAVKTDPEAHQRLVDIRAYLQNAATS